MKKQWIVVGVAIMGVSLAAFGAAAQGPGPQGVGAEEAAKSHAPRSYNPIKWVKKGPNTTTEPLDAKGDQDKNLTSKLQVQGLLPANTNLKDTCSAIRGLDECVAALHAGHNLGLDFNCLKSNLTGVRTGTVMSSCTVATRNKAMSLSNAIHVLKPDADAKAEAKNAEKQAHDDLKGART
jgi:hypothetical protein